MARTRTKTRTKARASSTARFTHRPITRATAVKDQPTKYSTARPHVFNVQDAPVQQDGLGDGEYLTTTKTAKHKSVATSPGFAHNASGDDFAETGADTIPDPVPGYQDEDVPALLAPTTSHHPKSRTSVSIEASVFVSASITLATSISPTTARAVAAVAPSINSHPIFHPTTQLPPSPTSSTPSAESTGSVSSQSNGPHPATAAIILAAIGSACLLAVILVIGRYICFRPRRRTRLVPSKPIPQDSYAEESPIFGSKGKFSPNEDESDDGPLWAWTQYPVPAKTDSNIRADEMGSSTEKSTYRIPRKSPPNTAAPGGITGVIPTIQVALQRSASRLSHMSASVYTRPNSTEVGVAITGSPLTGDGQAMLNRSLSRKGSSARVSIRGSAYGGVEIASPAMGQFTTSSEKTLPLPSPVPRSASNTSGRARIKTPYAAGNFIRPATSVSSHADVSPKDLEYTLPPLPSLYSSDDRRERSTRALTSALGLSPPTSPAMTIRPDDSLSVIAERMEEREQEMEAREREYRRLQAQSTDASATLGKLMLMDFMRPSSILPSSKSAMHSATTAAAAPAGTGGAGGAEDRGLAQRAAGTTRGTLSVGPLQVQKKPRTDDGPPRVPSPPPLPSLAQMAMEHASKQDYDDYRSPTYSLYAYYGDAERKSRAGV